jgi:four helix bundle protein
MKIERFDEIEAWQLARELTKKIYRLTNKEMFARDFGLKKQIQNAAGSAMHNIAEGFDSDTTAEFLRFLRYAKRSCSEVQSELYIALDQKYISESEFQEAFDHAGRTRATIRGFIKYLLAYTKKTAQIERETGNRKRETQNAKLGTGNSKTRGQL